MNVGFSVIEVTIRCKCAARRRTERLIERFERDRAQDRLPGAPRCFCWWN